MFVLFADSSISSSGNAMEGVDGQGVAEVEWAEEVMREEAERVVECEVVEGGSEEPGEKEKRPPGRPYFLILMFGLKSVFYVF